MDSNDIWDIRDFGWKHFEGHDGYCDVGLLAGGRGIVDTIASWDGMTQMVFGDMHVGLGSPLRAVVGLNSAESRQISRRCRSNG